MAILKVARLGHPILRKKARELSLSEIRSIEVERLIDNMIETMHEYGGIGLAAPQVHESVRLALIELTPDAAGEGRYPAYLENLKQPLGVYINPKITYLTEETQGFWEGCLSVPDMRGLVHRPKKVQIDFLDEKGKKHQLIAEDFLATVFQHELDHLDGVVYLDRVKFAPGESPIAFNEEYSRYHAPDEEDEEEELED